jgi:hypothetical protein
MSACEAEAAGGRVVKVGAGRKKGILGHLGVRRGRGRKGHCKRTAKDIPAAGTPGGSATDTSFENVTRLRISLLVICVGLTQR